MPDFITLTCPSCGGKLNITNDMQRFACSYCGTEHIVKRGEGVISLAPVVEGLRNVQTGVDKTASELAINRLKGELAGLEVEINRMNKVTSSTSCSIIGIIMAAFGGLLLLVILVNNSAGMNESNSTLCFTSLIFIIIGVLIVFVINRGNHVAEKKREAEKAPLMKLWQKKLEELKYHQNIVSK